MKTPSLLPALLALLQLQHALAQQESQATQDLTTSTMTMLDNAGSTLTATLTLVNSARETAAQEVTAQDATPSTFATTPSPETSVLQATRTESRYIPTASSSSSPAVDVEAGASGSSSSGFSLSRGGMIAVIVVVVGVAVFGVLSITLFILAKKRQWKVRESIKRASRRLTGRPNPPKSRSDVDRRKRSGVVAGSGRRGPPGTPLVDKSQRKGTAVSETEMRDLEKGQTESKNGSNGWLGKMKGNDWR